MKRSLGLIAVFVPFIIQNQSLATPIDCNEHGPQGRRVCEDRERLVEHEKVFTKKVITYKVETIEDQPDATPPTTTATPGPATDTPRIAEPGNRPDSNRRSGIDNSRRHHRRDRTERSNADSGGNSPFLTCVADEDYNTISDRITNGRIANTGNGYYDELIRKGNLEPTTRGILVGDRVALVCPETDTTPQGQPAQAGRSGHGGGGPRNSGATSTATLTAPPENLQNFQDILTNPSEAAATRLVPVESTHSWTETWYEKVIEQFCWWVPDDAIVDPVTLESITTNNNNSTDTNSGNGEPAPEPATMVLFGSIMAFFPMLKRRFFG